MRDRKLWFGLAAGGVCSAGFIFAGSRIALPCVLLLGLLVGAHLAFWVYRDSRRTTIDAWTLAAVLAWPLALPPYLILTRGMRGLIPAAGVLFVFFMLPFSFLAAIVQEERAASGFIAEGRAIHFENGEAALELFEKAARTDRDNFQAYFLVFNSAFELGRPKTAALYHDLLRRQGRLALANVGKKMAWFVSMLHYERFAASYEKAQTGRVSDARWKSFVALDEEWDSFVEGLGGRLRRRLARLIEDGNRLSAAVRSLRTGSAISSR